MSSNGPSVPQPAGTAAVAVLESVSPAPPDAAKDQPLPTSPTAAVEAESAGDRPTLGPRGSAASQPTGAADEAVRRNSTIAGWNWLVGLLLLLSLGRWAVAPATDPQPLPPTTRTIQIDINQASEAEFRTLPGLGAVLSRRIVEYRQTNGPFQQIEDLRNVPGLGPGMLGNIRAYLTLTPAAIEESSLASPLEQ